MGMPLRYIRLQHQPNLWLDMYVHICKYMYIYEHEYIYLLNTLSYIYIGGGGFEPFKPFKPFKPIKVPENSTPCKEICENPCGYSNGRCIYIDMHIWGHLYVSIYVI
jgi:hypothetical protein